MDVTLGTLHEYPLISSFLIGFPLWNSRDTAVLLQTRAVTGKSKDSRRIIWFQSHLCGLLFLLDSSWSYSRLSWHVVCLLVQFTSLLTPPWVLKSHMSGGWITEPAEMSCAACHPGPCWFNRSQLSRSVNHLWTMYDPLGVCKQGRLSGSPMGRGKWNKSATSYMP